MTLTICIRNNATREERICTMRDVPTNEHTRYWLAKGNYSCDCNREATFDNDPNRDEDVRCSGGRYSILWYEGDDWPRTQLET